MSEMVDRVRLEGEAIATIFLLDISQEEQCVG
jgi:hypothetical protein